MAGFGPMNPASMSPPVSASISAGPALKTEVSSLVSPSALLEAAVGHAEHGGRMGQVAEVAEAESGGLGAEVGSAGGAGAALDARPTRSAELAADELAELADVERWSRSWRPRRTSRTRSARASPRSVRTGRERVSYGYRGGSGQRAWEVLAVEVPGYGPGVRASWASAPGLTSGRTVLGDRLSAITHHSDGEGGAVSGIDDQQRAHCSSRLIRVDGQRLRDAEVDQADVVELQR